MIAFDKVFDYCCEDPALIENYDKAIKDDTQYWHCHHRLEIQGNKVYSSKELKRMGLYYNRPACEFIFLTCSDHSKLHGFNRFNGWNEKISKSNMGHEVTTETRIKMGKTRRENFAKMSPEERKAKMGHRKGKTPWNKGKKFHKKVKIIIESTGAL